MPERTRTFEPTFEVDGPYERGSLDFADAAARWWRRIGIGIAAVLGVAAWSFVTAALLRHFGVI